MESRWRTSVFAAARRSATVMSSASPATDSPSKLHLSTHTTMTRPDPQVVVVVPTPSRMRPRWGRARRSSTRRSPKIMTSERRNRRWMSGSATHLLFDAATGDVRDDPADGVGSTRPVGCAGLTDTEHTVDRVGDTVRQSVYYTG